MWDNELCRKTHPILLNSMLCAGYTSGGIAPCRVNIYFSILHVWPCGSRGHLIEEGLNSSTALTQSCRKRRLSVVFGKVINYFLIMFLYYQICAT